MQKTVFSGEPLPIPPKVDDNELDAFHRKIVDYLRRLGAKLSQYIEGGNRAVDAYSGFKDANQANSATFADVTWTDDLWKDAPFNHDGATDPEEVTVVQDGLYLILLDLEFDSSSGFPCEAQILVTDGATSFVPNFGTGSVGIEGTLSMSVTLPLPADAVIVAQAKDTAGTGNILARGSRLTILRLAQDSSGGTNTTPGVGYDPSWYTAMP